MLGSRTHIVALSTLLGLPPVAAAAPTIVDTCNQSINGAGVLGADLDCTGLGLPAVTIENPGSLDLAGFEILGGAVGVLCKSGCAIYSSGARGTIRDSATFGVRSTGETVTIENVTITGCGSDGVNLPKFSFREDEAVVIDSEISNCSGNGINATNARVIRSAISGNGDGMMLVGALRLIDSEVSGNLGAGAMAGASPLNLTNERGAKVVVRGSTVSGNGNGLVMWGPASFENSAIDDNLGSGVIFDVHESRIKCRNTSFDRNGADGLYWQDAPFDVTAVLKQCSASENGLRGLHIDAAEAHLERLVAVELTVAGNGDDGIFGAVEPGTMVFKRSTISDNGGYGVANPQWVADARCDIKLVSGSVSAANGTLAACGTTRACADIAACSDGKVTVTSDASCDTSYVLESGLPGANWAVCGSD